MIRTPFVSRALAVACAATLALPALVSHADVITRGGGVTLTPGGRMTQTGFRTAVIAATATNGDINLARGAMLAANMAMGRVPGYISIPASEVAAGFGKTALRDRMDARDYVELGKKLKAQRIMTVTVSPGDTSDAAAASTAIVELYDTMTGGLVGRGQGTYTATAEQLTADSQAQTKPPANAGTMAEALPMRSLGGAVFQAINELTRPATFRGVVISIPGAYTARLSIGERQGLRNGARIEYLDGGAPIAYGTVVDLGVGESLATVAPEANVTEVGLNTTFRTVSNPSADRAGKSAEQQYDAEFKRFEGQFALGLAVAGLIYYVSTR